MKTAKILGPAVGAILALACIGASPALAAETTLCKTSEGPYCASSNRYPAETSLSTSSGKVTLLTPIMDVTCSVSALSAKTTASSGAPLPVSVSGWSLEKCSDPEGTKCVGEVKGLPYTGSLARTEEANGSLTLGSGGTGQPRLFVQCGSFMQCEWTPPPLKLEGGSNAKFTIPKTSLEKKGGALCPSSATVESQGFSLTSPQAAWVEKVAPPPTGALCSAAEALCASGNLYPQGTTIEAKATDFKIDNSAWTFTCSSVSLSAKTKVPYGNPITVENQAFTLSGCEIPALGKTSCEKVTAPAMFNGAIWNSGSNDTLDAAGLQVNFYCNQFIHCTYTVPAGSFAVQGGNPAVLEMKALKLEINDGCGSAAYMTGTFTVSSPKPLYVTETIPSN